MFERFTERARQVVVLAQEEARHLHNHYIDTPHILLGILREEEGLGAKALDALSLDLKEVQAIIPKGTEDPLSGQIPFTDEAKKVLELSLREAITLGHNYIGTEHVLLSLIAYPGTVLSDFFYNKLGKQWKEIIRLEIDELLRGNQKPSPSEVERDNLEATDVLADLLTGFKMWRETKVEKGEWTDEDEALARWVEGSRAAEYL